MEPSSANNICLDVIRHQQSKTPQPRESGNPGQAVLYPQLPPPSLKRNEFGEYDPVVWSSQVPMFNWGTELNCVETFFGRSGLAALGGELGAFVPTLPWGWTNSSQSHPRKTCLAPHPILLVDLHCGSFRQCFFPTISRCRQQRLDQAPAGQLQAGLCCQTRAGRKTAEHLPSIKEKRAGNFQAGVEKALPGAVGSQEQCCLSPCSAKCT